MLRGAAQELFRDAALLLDHEQGAVLPDILRLGGFRGIDTDVNKSCEEHAQTNRWALRRVLPWTTLEVISKHRFVPPVRPEHHIERIADEGHRADDPIERNVADHPKDETLRRAELARFVNEVERRCGRYDIADTRDQPD